MQIVAFKKNYFPILIQILGSNQKSRDSFPFFLYLYLRIGALMYWLSLLYNFIQQSLLAACRRFEMVRISDNDPGWIWGVNAFHRSTVLQKQFVITLIMLIDSSSSIQSNAKYLALGFTQKVLWKPWRFHNILWDTVT